MLNYQRVYDGIRFGMMQLITLATSPSKNLPGRGLLCWGPLLRFRPQGDVPAVDHYCWSGSSLHGKKKHLGIVALKNLKILAILLAMPPWGESLTSHDSSMWLGIYHCDLVLIPFIRWCSPRGPEQSSNPLLLNQRFQWGVFHSMGKVLLYIWIKYQNSSNLNSHMGHFRRVSPAT